MTTFYRFFLVTGKRSLYFGLFHRKWQSREKKKSYPWRKTKGKNIRVSGYFGETGQGYNSLSYAFKAYNVKDMNCTC